MPTFALVIALFTTATARATEHGPRNEVRIAISCELELASNSSVEVKVGPFRRRSFEEATVRTNRDFELDSASRSTEFFGGSFNRESLDFLFALVPRGTLLKSPQSNEKIGNSYVLTINPVFSPRALWRASSGDHTELAEDAISAGRLRGQTRGWVNISVFDDGRIAGYTLVGHLQAKRVKIENGELEFTMPMELVDLDRIPRRQRWLGRVVAAFKLGAGVHSGRFSLKVKLKITAGAQAPLQIENAIVVPLDVPNRDEAEIPSQAEAFDSRE